MLLLKVQLQLRQQPSSAGRPGKRPRGRAVVAPVAVCAPLAPAERAPVLPQPVPLQGLPPPPSLPPDDDPPPPLRPGPALSPRPPPVVVPRLLQRLESTQPSPSLATSG